MRPLLVVPPVSRWLAGPPAAAAALAGAVPALETLDLNARWLRAHESDDAARSNHVGDHAKPEGGFRKASDAWDLLVNGAFLAAGVRNIHQVRRLHVGHEEMERALQALHRGPLGAWVAAALPIRRPTLVAVSVLFADQVVGALLVAMAARERWRDVPIVLGGAHITALSEVIAHDRGFARWADGFVAGYAEHTFARLCQEGLPGAEGVIVPGSGRLVRATEAPHVNRFTDLELYGVPQLTLPIQTSRGCAYGRCTFCTYPAIEGGFRRIDLALIRPTVQLGAELGADLVARDALMPLDDIDALAALVAGRCRFSVSTRLRPRPGRERLRRWAQAGLHTVEVGVESVDDATLRRIDKRQGREDVEALLDAASGLPVRLVLNVMFGWPGQSRDEALAELAWFTDVLPVRYPSARFSTERNLLEVERRSPMGRAPERFGVRVTGAWPWASTLAWDAPEWRGELQCLMSGHHQETEEV